MLPTNKTKPKNSLADLSILIYGASKIGKSTFCSKAEDALFLATEPGLNSLDVHQVNIQSWRALLNVCGDLAKGDHKFKTVIIDTIDNAYNMCNDYICAKYGVEHVGDHINKLGEKSGLDFGKGWAMLAKEFNRVLTRLAFLPYGLILISHSKERDIKKMTMEQTRICPTLPDAASKIVTGLVDIILYCDIELSTDSDGVVTSRRVFRTKPSTDYDAGDRTCKLPETMLMDYNLFVETLKGDKNAQ